MKYIIYKYILFICVYIIYIHTKKKYCNSVDKHRTASTEEDQHLFRHCCLFSSAHRFAPILFTREANTQIYVETKQ